MPCSITWATTLTDLLHSGAPADVLERALDRQMRVMARTVLDGYPAGQLQKRFPNIAEPDSTGCGHVHDNDTSARLAVANALALQFGWRLFAPILRSATGLDELTDAELRAGHRRRGGPDRRAALTKCPLPPSKATSWLSSD